MLDVVSISVFWRRSAVVYFFSTEQHQATAYMLPKVSVVFAVSLVSKKQRTSAAPQILHKKKTPPCWFIFSLCPVFFDKANLRVTLHAKCASTESVSKIWWFSNKSFDTISIYWSREVGSDANHALASFQINILETLFNLLISLSLNLSRNERIFRCSKTCKENVKNLKTQKNRFFQRINH